MSLEIIPAQTEHIEGMAKAYLSAFGEFNQQHGLSSYPDTIESSLQMYESLVKEDFGHPIVALFDGEVAGSTWLRLSDEVVAFEDVTVATDMQGKGIARPLMQHGLKTASEMGYERIRLTQSGHNSKALSLYASLGFQVKESFAGLSATASRSFSVMARTPSEAPGDVGADNPAKDSFTWKPRDAYSDRHHFAIHDSFKNLSSNKCTGSRWWEVVPVGKVLIGFMMYSGNLIRMFVHRRNEFYSHSFSFCSS